MRKRYCYANVGSSRYKCELIKENALTVLVKINPTAMMAEMREWFLHRGVSMREYRRMLEKQGITRDGYSKRHKLKDVVIII